MNDRGRGTRLFVVLGTLLALTGPALAANWDRFRGPNGTGVSDDRNVPVRWTERDVLWKTALPGVGHSSPVIWGDRIFLQSAASDGSARWLLCLDAKAGKLLWQKKAAGRGARTHKRNTLASSTPATDGTRVYAVFWDGSNLHLSAFDFKGNEEWSRDLGKFRSQHGAGLSPIVHDGRVFLNNDQDGSAVLQAFDASTGRDLWQAPRQAHRTCYSTPLIRDKDGKSELIVASTAGITSYDPSSGKENWAYHWKNFNRMPLRTVASPIVADGLVVATSGDGAGDRHAIAVRLGGKGDVTSTHLAWEDRRAFPYVPTLLARGEYVFSVNDQGFAGCYRAKNGKPVWRERLSGLVSSSPILVDGKVYIVDERGDVYVFPAAAKFELLAKNSLGERVFSTPAVANGRLYIRGAEHLFCIGKDAQSK
jgi:outer membrane protein assembly factor BamB